jgi:hypothetical protein
MTDIVDAEKSNRLPELAARIRAEDEACTAALKRGLQHAAAAGKLLIEAKAKLPHGQWLPWLRDHCSLSERKAQRYMAIAPHVCKTDILSDLPSSSEAITLDFAKRYIEAPFTELDFADADADAICWLNLKLSQHANVPRNPTILLTFDAPAGYDLLRLCPFDELTSGIKALLPFANKEKPFRIDRASMSDMLAAIEHLTLLASILVGRLLKEAKYRFDHREEQLSREFDETHAAWMASLEAKRAEIKHQRAGAAP